MSDLHDLQSLLPQSKMALATDAGALAAVVSPWWLPWLKEVSEIASFTLPIIGVIWLCVQIVVKLYEFGKKHG